MKKVVEVIITDTHTKEENIAVVESIFDQARKLALKYKTGRILHAGDIYNSRKGQVLPNLKSFEKVLSRFEHDNLILEAIPGNHDKTDYKSHDSFLDPFAHHPAFELNRDAVMSCNERGPRVDIYMMPFFADELYIEEMQRGFARVNGDVPGVLITHIGLNGAIMNNGIAVKTKINQDLFNCFQKVLVGHYHDPAKYGKVEYIGASLQHNFGESPNKGATILYDDLSTEIVALEFPKYLAYEINADDVTVKDIKDFEKARKESGDQLRIILTGSEASIKAFDKQRLIDVGIDVKKKENDINADDVEASVDAFTDKSILAAFKQFCKKNELSEKDGLKYLKQVF